MLSFQVFISGTGMRQSSSLVKYQSKQKIVGTSRRKMNRFYHFNWTISGFPTSNLAQKNYRFDAGEDFHLTSG